MEENALTSSVNICRICMIANPETRSLFANLGNSERTLGEILSFVTNINVKPEDMFSKEICNNCETYLYQLDQFKRRSIENQVKLQGLHSGNQDSISIKNEVEIRPFQCSLCYHQYSDITDLQSHVFSSHGQGTLLSENINKVDETELSKKNIKEEVDTADYGDDGFGDHDENEILCEVDVKIDTESFVPKEEPDKKYKCNLCNTYYKNQHSYRKHIRNIHEKTLTTKQRKKIEGMTGDNSGIITKYEAKLIKVTNYKCNICSTYYKNQKSYRKHIRTKHEDKKERELVKTVKFDKHQCSHCMRSFVKKSTLIQHLKRHEATKIHICTLCKREFMHKAHLDNHVLAIHTTQDGHQCDVCEATFPTPESLEIHRTSHDSQKKHQCKICSKSFHMLSTLKDHERVHTGERPYLCPTCGKGFTQNTNLQEHMRRHAGIKPFHCELCPRRFVAKGELAAHLRKHSGAHPFVCVECGGRFTTSSSLVKHKRTHSGERPYACDLCPMRFAASGTLKNHRRTHTGEKPYKCTHCEKAFVQKNDLVSHTRCHTGERPYVCPTCGQAFRQSSALKTHLKMHPHVPNV